MACRLALTELATAINHDQMSIEAQCNDIDLERADSKEKWDLEPPHKM